MVGVRGKERDGEKKTEGGNNTVKREASRVSSLKLQKTKQRFVAIHPWR